MFRRKSLVLLTAILLISLVAARLWRHPPATVAAGTVPRPPQEITVAVIKAGRRPIDQQLTISSELVPFQQIDVYAKESGYVKQLFVDYGTHVKTGQVIATLEIPELQVQLEEDNAAIRAAADQVKQAGHQLDQIEAEANVRRLEYQRLNSVFQKQPGLVAQQEVDDAQGRYLEAAAQVEEVQAQISAAQNQLAAAQAKLSRDQVLFDYSKIIAPFSGVITKRYANLGTLVQAGTDSSTQALPIVQLSQDSLFRLVIPVPESYVHYIHIGDRVQVYIPSLNETFPGRIARFSVDVNQQTRTMHTEVDVPNPAGKLMPGLYAEAKLALAGTNGLVAIPVQALHQDGGQSSVDVVDPSGLIEQRSVTTGLTSANWVAIDSGLRAGELVVTGDASGLLPGEKVVPQITAPMQYKGSGGNSDW
jgi:RND family efflux transporter MFP subunit